MEPISDHSRSATLRTSLPVRLLFTVIATAFVAATVLNRGGSVALVALLAVMSLCLVVATLIAWTGGVWIDYDRRQIHQSLLIKDAVRSLEQPATVQLRRRVRGVGRETIRGWELRFREPGLTDMPLASPWVRVGELLLLLQPAVARNDRLPADDFTREAIAHPAQVPQPPPGSPNDA